MLRQTIARFCLAAPLRRRSRRVLRRSSSSVSHFLPGGGAGPDASPPEKVYVVLSGELTVIVDGKESVLKANDSCFIGSNESREIINRTNEVYLVAGGAPVRATRTVSSPAKGGAIQFIRKR